MWLTIAATVLEILAPLILSLMKSIGTSEERQKRFQEWVASFQARRNAMQAIKDAGKAQEDDIKQRINEVSPSKEGEKGGQ